MTSEQRREKRDRDREVAFKERTARQFEKFWDCALLAEERACVKARKLKARDRAVDHHLERDFEMLLARGFRSRMSTQIVNHPEWLAEDCARWLEQLGVESHEVEWITLEAAKKRARAARAQGAIVRWPVRRKTRKRL